MMKKYLLALAAVVAFNVSARAEEVATEVKAQVVEATVVDQELKNDVEAALVKALETAKTPEERVEVIKTLSEEIQKENPVLFAGLTREQKKSYAKYALYTLVAVAAAYGIYCTYQYWKYDSIAATEKELLKDEKKVEALEKKYTDIKDNKDMKTEEIAKIQKAAVDARAEFKPKKESFYVFKNVVRPPKVEKTPEVKK